MVTCKSGSAGRAGETDQPKGGHRAPTRPQPIVQDASLAAALVDRILHHGEVFYLKGPSCRVKGRGVDGELNAADHRNVAAVIRTCRTRWMALTPPLQSSRRTEPMAAWLQHTSVERADRTILPCCLCKESACPCRKRGAPTSADGLADLMASSTASNTSAAAKPAAAAAHRLARSWSVLVRLLLGLSPAHQKLLRRQNSASRRRVVHRHGHHPLRHT